MGTLDNNTTQFYVVLTGTSSLLSGIMMFLEWLHFTIYGISIFDRITTILTSILPISLYLKKEDSTAKQKKLSEAKPYRNSILLFRGAELYRYQAETGKAVITDYDFRLSTYDLVNLFMYEGAKSHDQSEILMDTVLKDDDRSRRIEMAHKALEINPNCIAALFLLAEEEAQGLLEVEELLKQSVRAAESSLKHSSELCQQDPVYKPLHERNANVFLYCRLRLAVCVRRLGKIKEAIKMYRDLLKDPRTLYLANIYENLTECFLEAQSYSELNTFLQKQEETLLYKSTTLCYTIALLKIKALGDRFCPEAIARRGPTAQELAACEAIHRAVEQNPHVPKYLLELKALIPPPEHLVKRGDSEAIAYAFHNLAHWKRIEGAIPLLANTWEGTFQHIPFPLERGHLFAAYPSYMEVVDRELLPSHHEVSVFPQREIPFFMVFTGVLFFSFMSLTVVAYHFPRAMTRYAKTLTTICLSILDQLLPKGMLGF